MLWCGVVAILQEKSNFLTHVVPSYNTSFDIDCRGV